MGFFATAGRDLEKAGVIGDNIQPRFAATFDE
jgi:hypothetical protein